MILDSKTILTNQKIEQDRQKLLAQLLAERYGMTTRPDNQDKTD
jgi:hypothetical protein